MEGRRKGEGKEGGKEEEKKEGRKGEKDLGGREEARKDLKSHNQFRAKDEIMGARVIHGD